jgi:p-aminobenzoyl-glutamate transporter AbgT
MSETKTGTAGSEVPKARQTTESAAPDSKGSGGFLGLIERAGDRIPHPALLFLILCGIVIVLSQALYLAGVQATSEVAVPPPSQAQYVEEGGSTVPAYDIPPAPGPQEYHIERETTHVQGLLTGNGVRFIFTSTVDNFNGLCDVMPLAVSERVGGGQ